MSTLISSDNVRSSFTHSVLNRVITALAVIVLKGLSYYTTRFVARIFPLLLFAGLFLPASALAQGLLVTDCQGFTRALQQVKPGELSKIDFQINDALGNPLDGVEVQLTNTATGEVTTVVSQNGVASFQNVASGSFSVSSSATGVSVGTVSVSSMGVGTVAATGAVAGAGVTAGGAAVGITNVVTDVIDSNSPDPTPTPTPEPTPTPTPEPQPTLPPAPAEDCCTPDETPDPLDPGDFFNDPPPMSPLS